MEITELERIRKGIKFKFGALVYYKHQVKSFFPGMVYIIINIFPDDDGCENRIGELGNSNRYQCISLLDESKQVFFQHQLQSWAEVRDDVIDELTGLLNKFKGID